MILPMKDPFKVGFGTRLRAAMTDVGIETAADLADLLKQEHSRVRGWVNGGSIAPVTQALRLKEILGVTLDWLYENDSTGLTEAKRIRLWAILQGIDPPKFRTDGSLEPDHIQDLSEAPAESVARGGSGRKKGKARATG